MIHLDTTVEKMSSKAKTTSLGNYLRELRLSKGLTLQALAKAISIDTSLLSKIELGERGLNMDLVPRLADALQMDFKALQVDLMVFKMTEDYGKEEFVTEALKKALTQIS
jgi:transcriptional regulator with XRE-family HTH domain